MPRDDWEKARRTDLAAKSHKAQRQGQPRVADIPKTYEEKHKSDLAEQFRTFQKTGIGADAQYSKTCDLFLVSRSFFSYEPDDLSALKKELEGTESTQPMLDRLRDTALERGGDLLRRAWPLYDLLSMLPDNKKAEDLRMALGSATRKKNEYTITLTPTEHATLASALQAGKERV